MFALLGSNRMYGTIKFFQAQSAVHKRCGLLLLAMVDLVGAQLVVLCKWLFLCSDLSHFYQRNLPQTCLMTSPSSEYAAARYCDSGVIYVIDADFFIIKKWYISCICILADAHQNIFDIWEDIDSLCLPAYFVRIFYIIGHFFTSPKAL